MDRMGWVAITFPRKSRNGNVGDFHSRTREKTGIQWRYARVPGLRRLLRAAPADTAFFFAAREEGAAA
jgi:hypothetical protein